MPRRPWITLGLLLSGGALATLAVGSVLAWLRSWRAILTGADLTSPLGCDCGVAISFWQHPWVYGVGLATTLLLVSLTLWLVTALVLSWRNTQQAIRRFTPLPTPPEIENSWIDLRSQVLPRWWPTWLRPQLQIIQAEQPRAMSTGLVYPTVFCSTGTLQHLTTPEVRAILTHELMHIKSLDQILLWIVRSWTSGFPAQLREAVRLRVTEFIECQTDQEAAALVGSSALGKALLSVAAWQPMPVLSAAAHVEGVVEIRLQVLAGWLRSPSFPWKPVAVASLWLVSLLITAAALFTQVNTVYAQDLRSPACLEAESVVLVNHELVLFCPHLGKFEESYLPMSPVE